MRYDERADRLTLTFCDAPVARTYAMRFGVSVHLTRANRLANIEIAPARRVVSHVALLRLSSPDEYLTLREAAREADLSPITLRVQIRNGRIAATMRGRDWLIARDELRWYLENRGKELD